MKQNALLKKDYEMSNNKVPRQGKYEIAIKQVIKIGVQQSKRKIKLFI